MILRAALSLGLVWLSLPHQPDLGFSVSAPLPCAVLALCAGAPGGTIAREAIFRRLRQMRVELQGAGKAISNLQSANGAKTWRKV